MINDYFNDLTKEQINALFKKSEEIIFFYGFKKDELLNIIKKGAIHDSRLYKLTDLYGVTNAILFQLKYKLNNKNAAGLKKSA
jgi:hypothetical protein